jgi:hypothetical protein
VQQKLEEHKYLNEQIINHQRLIFQIFTFSVIAAVAILGWGLQNFPKSGTEASGFSLFILLAPMAIILPCAFIISAIREEVFGWAAYIIVFHKSEYEIALDRMRVKAGRFRESYTSIGWTYWVFFAMCSGLFMWGIWNSPMHNGLCALVVIPFVILLLWYLKFSSIPSNSNRERLKEEWREAKRLVNSEKRM